MCFAQSKWFNSPALNAIFDGGGMQSSVGVGNTAVHFGSTAKTTCNFVLEVKNGQLCRCNFSRRKIMFQLRRSFYFRGQVSNYLLTL